MCTAAVAFNSPAVHTEACVLRVACLRVETPTCRAGTFVPLNPLALLCIIAMVPAAPQAVPLLLYSGAAAAAAPPALTGCMVTFELVITVHALLTCTAFLSGTAKVAAFSAAPCQPA